MTCADRDVHLAEQLTGAAEEGGIEYAQVLQTFNACDVAIIKSILDGAGIIYCFGDEFFLSVRLLVEPARLIVARGQVELVRELLEDLDLSFKGISGSKK